MKKLMALCSSFKCTGKHILNYSNAVEKDVPISAVSCPDCGGGLLWMKKAKYRTHHAAKPKVKKVYEL